MDLLDRLLEHDRWTTRQLLIRCRTLSDEQLDRDLGIGHRSVRATLLHVIRNIEVWTDVMRGEDRSTNVRDARDREDPEAMIERLEMAAGRFAALAREVRDRGAWNDRWLDTLDDPPREKSYAGAIAHLITHSMHHRAQVLYMLRRLGVSDLPEGDVLSWERQAGAG